jgi:hypothetical protein
MENQYDGDDSSQYTLCEEYGHDYLQSEEHPGHYYCVDCGDTYNEENEA